MKHTDGCCVTLHSTCARLLLLLLLLSVQAEVPMPARCSSKPSTMLASACLGVSCARTSAGNHTQRHGVQEQRADGAAT